jgi:hypothetical protein
MEIIKLKNKIDLSDIKNRSVEENESDNESEKYNIEDNIPNITDLYTPLILTPEEAKEKRKKIIHIKNYIKTFPDILNEFSLINLSEKSILELDNYIEEIKIMVCSGNNSDLYLGLFQGGCNIIEKGGSYLNYDLTGLSHYALKNDNIIKCVKEISLEYNQMQYIPPEKRLLLLMFSLCYGVNQMNTMKNNINNHMESNIKEELNKKYNDL